MHNERGMDYRLQGRVDMRLFWEGRLLVRSHRQEFFWWGRQDRIELLAYVLQDLANKFRISDIDRGEIFNEGSWNATRGTRTISLHIFDDVVQHYSMGLVVLLHTAECHNTKFSNGAAKAQFSRIRVGLGGGGLIGRNFVSPVI